MRRQRQRRDGRSACLGRTPVVQGRDGRIGVSDETTDQQEIVALLQQPGDDKAPHVVWCDRADAAIDGAFAQDLPHLMGAQ